MVSKIMMPKLSLTMKEGTVIEWFKKEGDIVNKGEPIVEVLSEKATYEVESPASGILRKIIAEEGTDIPVAGTLGIITAQNERLPEKLPEEFITIPSDIEAKKPAVETPMILEKAKRKKVRRTAASPAARKLAREQGIDITQIQGTGPQGRIVEGDVKNLFNEIKIMPRVREIIPLTGIRKTAAERVSLSARTSPQSTLTMEVEMSPAIELHEKTGISYTDMLVKAVANALKKHPMINSTLEKDQIKIFADINIGMAVATETGLIVPVIHNVDQKSLKETSAEIKNLVEKARQSKLTKEDLAGGTFTITNLGMYGVKVFVPIINPPETAILGVGMISEIPRVVKGQVAVRPIMQLSLTFDHRVVDGAPAAEFLRDVKKEMEKPNWLQS